MIVKDFVLYLKSPRPAVPPPLPRRGKTGEWFFLLLVYVVACGLVCLGMVLYGIGGGDGEGVRTWGQAFFTETNLKTLSPSGIEKYAAWGLFVAVQPVVYGLMFRYALAPFDWKRVRVSFSFVLITAAFLLLWRTYRDAFEARLGFLAQQILYCICLYAMLAVVYIGIELRGRGTWKLGKYWDKDFPFFFYLMVGLTMLLSPMSYYAWWVLLLQGLILGYAAVRLGFWHSVGLHAAMNVLALLCIE